MKTYCMRGSGWPGCSEGSEILLCGLSVQPVLTWWLTCLQLCKVRTMHDRPKLHVCTGMAGASLDSCENIQPLDSSLRTYRFQGQMTICASIHNLVMSWWSPLQCCSVLFNHACPTMVYIPLVGTACTVEPHLTDTLKSGHLRYCRHFVWSRTYFHMFVYNQTAKLQNPPYSIKWTGSPVATVPELCKFHSIIQMLI